MEEKMKIFDVEISGFTAKAAMKKSIAYLQSESINSIEIVTSDMLLQGQDSPEWKALIQRMDLVIPGEKEILEAAGIEDKALLKQVSNKLYLRMFLCYLQKNRKKIFLIASSKQEMYALEEVLEKYNRGMLIVGRAVLDADGAAKDEVINEINGTETDCILSVLPSPQQEAFIVENGASLNARVWLGCGIKFTQDYDEKFVGTIRKFLFKKLFQYQVGRQTKEN
jgi:N-acetylglucosaminyldiphosphoundecaprenol N-acetyl-beta-D-mannosaminyltransferase